MAKFEVGDKAMHELHGEVTIEYGPYLGSTSVDSLYLVEDGDGVIRTVIAHHLSPIHTFSEGDQVDHILTVPHTRGVLVAGPFQTKGSPRWVMRKPDGSHAFPPETALRKVEPDTTFTPEPGVHYRDRDGDVWEWCVNESGEREAHVYVDGWSPERSLYSPEYVSETYGPLTRIEY